MNRALRKIPALIIFTLIIAIMSFILIYAGHFLFEEKADEEKKEEPGPVEILPPPVNYLRLKETINGNKQEINILEIDPGSEKVRVKPVLSFDSIFGFEKLTEIAARSNAYAAVNAGFFYEYGQPSGMVMIDGKLISASTGEYPVFIIAGGKAELKEIDMELRLSYGTGEIEIDSMNTLGNSGKAVVYTREFGTTNRAETENITVTVRNNKVESISEYSGEVSIPKEGFLLTFYKPYRYDLSNMPIQEGERVELIQAPALGEDAQAYECGDWIVKDGQIVIGERSKWVGSLENRDPRTAIGIKADGTIVLMTVDGRQPEHSVGFTGKELGDFLLKYGVVNAAMLDGGASTEMVLEGNIVNRPSYKGAERLVAGAFVVIMED